MAYTTAQARLQLLDTIAQAVEDTGHALASLGEAYELLDEHNADRLEQELFRPIQVAYGRAMRTYEHFAEQHDMPRHDFEPSIGGAPSRGVKGFLESAVDAVARADGALAMLQDSMLPVEVGDAELRAGLEDVRQLLSDLREKSRQFVRTLGR